MINLPPQLTMSDIGKSVGTVRKESRFTQKDFAELMGLNHRQTLTAIESGKRKIKPEELVKVMELTGKDLGYFTDPYRLREKPQWHFHVMKSTAQGTGLPIKKEDV